MAEAKDSNLLAYEFFNLQQEHRMVRCSQQTGKRFNRQGVLASEKPLLAHLVIALAETHDFRNGAAHCFCTAGCPNTSKRFNLKEPILSHVKRSAL